MNYAAPFAPGYAPQYAPPYAPQYGAMMPYPSTGVDDTKPPPDKTTTPDKPGITTNAWWQATTFQIPRWALATGAVALGTIGYGWNAGWFDGAHKAGAKKHTAAHARRDPGHKKIGHHKKRGHGGRHGHAHHALRGHRFDFDF